MFLEIPTQVVQKLIFRKNHVGKRLTNSHQEFKRDAQVRDNGQFPTWRTSCPAVGNDCVSDGQAICSPPLTWSQVIFHVWAKWMWILSRNERSKCSISFHVRSNCGTRRMRSTKVHSNTQCLPEIWLIMQEISRQLWTPSVLPPCAAGKNNTYHDHFSLQTEMKYDYARSALLSCVPLMPGVNISFTSKGKTKDLAVNVMNFLF